MHACTDSLTLFEMACWPVGSGTTFTVRIVFTLKPDSPLVTATFSVTCPSALPLCLANKGLQGQHHASSALQIRCLVICLDRNRLRLTLV